VSTRAAQSPTTHRGRQHQEGVAEVDGHREGAVAHQHGDAAKDSLEHDQAHAGDRRDHQAAGHRDAPALPRVEHDRVNAGGQHQQPGGGAHEAMGVLDDHVAVGEVRDDPALAGRPIGTAEARPADAHHAAEHDLHVDGDRGHDGQDPETLHMHITTRARVSSGWCRL